MNVLHNKDCNPAALKNKRVAVIGFGSQGHAHALNLKDSGFDVVVGLRKGSESWAKAEANGLQVFELVIPSIPIVGGKYRAIARVGDGHALRLIYEFGSKPFLIESDRPEIGMVWMKHQWRFPKAPGSPV